MKAGDLIELSAKKLREKTGGFATVRDSYKSGIVIEVEPDMGWDREKIYVTVLWNNGFFRKMPRSEVKFIK